MNGKVRIYELSKELAQENPAIENKDILTICEDLGIAVKSHSSTISDEDAERIRSVAASPGYRPAGKAPAQKAKPSRSIHQPSSPQKPVRRREQQILGILRPKRPTPPAPSKPEAATAKPMSNGSSFNGSDSNDLDNGDLDNGSGAPPAKPNRPALAGPPSRPTANRPDNPTAPAAKASPSVPSEPIRQLGIDLVLLSPLTYNQPNFVPSWLWVATRGYGCVAMDARTV